MFENRIIKISAGAIAGAFLGFLAGVATDAFIPGVSPFFLAIGLSATMVMSALGLVLGGVIGANSLQSTGVGSMERNDVKILLREEKLDIDTHKVEIADVDIQKEVVTEEKTVKVPLSREELVVEKGMNGHKEEALRIPLSEERIDVDKETVQLNEVSVHKREVKDTKTVDAKLKKETVDIEKH